MVEGSCIWIRGEGHGGTSTRYPNAASSTLFESNLGGAAPRGPPTWALRNPYPIVCISNKDGVRGDRVGVSGDISGSLK